MFYTRREIGKLALAGLPAASLLSTAELVSGRALAKPNSKWAGVQVGMNAPYNFGNNYMTGDEALDRCVQLGISAVELRSQPVELFLGAPLNVPAARGAARGATSPGGAPASATPAPPAAPATTPEALRQWRLGAPMGKIKDFRKKWEEAGVHIEIVKFDWISPIPADDILDYCFEMAKALGARAISTEVPLARMDDTKHLGEVAANHKIMVGYHGHTEVNAAIWEKAFSYSKYNGANLDIGHFVAGNFGSPIPFLKQYHERITHMHIKDRKTGLNGGANVAFGQGDTPIKEALQVLRDNKWKVQATIEFEYPVPQGSDRMAEMAKCVQYCKDCLVG